MWRNYKQANKTINSMNTRFNALAFLLFAVVYGAQAQDNHLKIHFDFSQNSGNGVTDIAGGINARLMGAARVEQVGRYHVLNLGNASGYLNMTNAAGAVVQALGDCTVSACYHVDTDASLVGNGFFLWTFSTSAACTQTEGRYMAYRLNAQRVATSAGGYGA